MKKERRQSFAHGAVILAAAGILVKIIGACYKIPLGSVLGPVGMANFSIAYNIYALLFVLSTAGVPSAVAKMIAEAYVNGRKADMKRIYRCAMCVFVFIGASGALFMFFCADEIAAFMGSCDAASSVRAVAPAVLFVSVSSINRGYYQGCSDMYPTAISEVAEAFGKLIFGLFAALYLKRSGFGDSAVSSGAVAGVSAGAVMSATFLMLCRKRHKGNECSGSRYTDIMKRLFSLAVPITVGAAVISLTNVIDSALVMNLLIRGGHSAMRAKWLFGAYNYTTTVFNLPSALITTLATAILPAVSGAVAKKDYIAADRAVNSALSAAMMIAFPAAFGMAALSYGITDLLYGAGVEAECIAVSSAMLRYISAAVPALAAVTVTNSFHHALDSANTPVISMLCGAAVKILSNIILVSNPEINIYGAPISTVLCYVTIAILNIAALKRYPFVEVSISKIIIKPMLSGMAVFFAARAAYNMMCRTINGHISTVFAFLVGVFAFLVCCFCTGVFESDGLWAALKGKSIFKFLNND